ncbi:hypothetical protein HQQ81_16370 [Microbacteriaceae bacterium VKM Ac-2854]|nr:hypothetical protein [Microbacteriaceae bacterium VKM Ac-2854]
MTDHRPLIAIVSAVSAAIPPAVEAFAELFPAARVWNILDDRLLVEIDERGSLTPELAERMQRLIQHAVTEGADGVLLSCSIYGSVAHAVAGTVPVPVLGADDAGFAAVIASGHRRILLVAPASAPLIDSTERLTAAALAADASLEIIPVVAQGAAGLARSGDVAGLSRLLVEAVARVDDAVDAVLLGQYSLAPAADALAEATGLPVYATPQRAALALKAALEIPVAEEQA